MVADENTNSTIELNNVKTVRPIYTKFDTKNLQISMINEQTLQQSREEW